MAAFGALVLVFEDARWSYASLPLGLAFVFMLVFFRDPPRTAGTGIVSPADGRVLRVDAANRRLTVFMGVSNVHVNRAPIDGRVASVVRTPGGHAPAYEDEAAHNERVEIILETDVGLVSVTQVVGVFARRIVPYVRRGDRVRKGQRIGMIRFGSRVEVALPRGARLVAKEGAIVRAGETTIAEVADGARA
jgi:phosphatidylserine decarboxylase